MNADLPDRKEKRAAAIDDERLDIPHEKLEKVIPQRKELVNSRKDDEKPARKRRRIFDSIKLDGSAKKSTIIDSESAIPKKETSVETDMPNKISLDETLFGGISESLPESDETLDAIRADIGSDCKRCRLCADRTQVVNSVGNPQADLMFIGEAPGADEDEQGEPFVGRAGQLLTKIIEAIDLKREDVFIGNINRCRPPKNRQPQADEAEVCKPFLLREIAVVRPKVIVVMGNTACQNLLETKVGITKLRGEFKDYFGVKVMPTFHPAYLLRDPRKKREVWEDMKTIREYLNASDSG